LRPGVVYWHTPNSGEGRSAFQGKTLKQQGVKAGIHDLLFLWGGIFGLEMKKPGGVLSPAQRRMHPLLLAAGMVASYQAQYQGDSGKCDTFSTAAASGYNALATAIKQFVDATASLTTANRTTLVTAANGSVTYDTTPFRDLGSFMTKVAAATSLPQTLRTAATAVTAAIGGVIVGKTADQRSSSGISVYLPTTSSDAYLATYATDAAAFCQATGWNTFAKWLATGTRSVSATATLVRPTPASSLTRSAGNTPAVNAAWAAFAASYDSTDTSVAKTRRRGVA
jgi:hypothetical protein